MFVKFVVLEIFLCSYENWINANLSAVYLFELVYSWHIYTWLCVVL